MKLARSLKSFFLPSVLGLFLCVSLTGCGGGSGGGSDANVTTRPKTLDGLVIILPGGVTFTFARNVGTDPAVANGQIETGSFTYTPGATNIQQFQNINGDLSDITFPDDLSDRTYTYLAVNDNSGVITLDGVSIDDLDQSGTFNAANNSFAYYFHSDSATSSNMVLPTHPTVQMDVTFSNNGAAGVSISGLVLAIVGSAFPELDTTLPQNVNFTLENGEPVPVNFNPIVDPLSPSRIVPESLSGRLILFTNGVPDPADDFTVQFVRDATLPSQNVDEVGLGLERVAGSVVNIGVQYSWTRIGGTDNATLFLSGGGNTFDGSYELQFSSADSGIYIGTVDAGTPDAAEVSGTFVIRSAN